MTFDSELRANIDFSNRISIIRGQLTANKIRKSSNSGHGQVWEKHYAKNNDNHKHELFEKATFLTEGKLKLKNDGSVIGCMNFKNLDFYKYIPHRENPDLEKFSTNFFGRICHDNSIVGVFSTKKLVFDNSYNYIPCFGWIHIGISAPENSLI